MKHISLGGLDVSRIGLGAMTMVGTYTGGCGLDDAESIRTIHRALELGVSQIDTAGTTAVQPSRSCNEEGRSRRPWDLTTLSAVPSAGGRRVLVKLRRVQSWGPTRVGGSTRATEIKVTPRSRILLSIPCSSAWSEMTAVRLVVPSDSWVKVRSPNQGAQYWSRCPSTRRW